MPSPYAELHCHSNFSFLEGASHIEELVLRARDLGYESLALTDHDGLHGAMEFARCARAWGLRPITGAEVTLAPSPRPFDIAQGRQLNRPRSVRVEAAEDGLPTAVWSASGGGRRGRSAYRCLALGPAPHRGGGAGELAHRR